MFEIGSEHLISAIICNEFILAFILELGIVANNILRPERMIKKISSQTTKVIPVSLKGVTKITILAQTKIASIIVAMIQVTIRGS